jgi:hypothetical protein
LVYTTVTIIPIALIFFYFRDYIRLPSDVATYFLSISSLIMAAFIQFFITYSLAMMAFWILEISTIVFIVYSFEYFLGGQMFPVDIMPVGVQAVMKWLPFYYELFLSDCNLPRPSPRRRASPSLCYSILLACRHLVRRPVHVETRPWPLPGRRWVKSNRESQATPRLSKL